MRNPMLGGAQWGCLICMIIFWWLSGIASNPAVGVGMFGCGLLMLCTAIILRALREVIDAVKS